MRRTNTISISAGASYSAPAVSVLEVEAEGLLCASSEYTLGGGGVYTTDDINDNGSY